MIRISALLSLLFLASCAALGIGSKPDVSGSWTFDVTLGQMGSGQAQVTLSEEADGKLTGTYSGQLSNGPFEGTYDNGSFSFEIEGMMANITYQGMLMEDGSLSGKVIAQGNEIGTFTAARKEEM